MYTNTWLAASVGVGRLAEGNYSRHNYTGGVNLVMVAILLPILMNAMLLALQCINNYHEM